MGKYHVFLVFIIKSSLLLSYDWLNNQIDLKWNFFIECWGTKYVTFLNRQLDRAVGQIRKLLVL